MSFIDMYRRNVAQKQKDIADLSHNKAREQTKLADFNKRIAAASKAVRKTSSASTLKSKMNEIERYQKDAAAVGKKIADFEEKIAKKHKELHAEQAKLTKEEQNEQQKARKELEKSQKAHEQAMRGISSGMQSIVHEQMRTRYEIEKIKNPPKSIVVLFLAANPIAQAQLRLDEEARAIHEKIRLSDFRDSVKFETRWAVRPLDILQVINECQPTIIHFSGHGAQDGSLVLQDANGRDKFVSIEAISQLLKTVSEEIRFMFFNCCFSKEQAASAVEHVEGAIGMNAAIGDDAARIFAAQFYSAIGFGKSVPIAFGQAKAALMLEDIPEEDTPELFLQDGIDADSLVLVAPELNS